MENKIRKNNSDEVTLNLYKPTIFIIIGATFNIVFASLFSIFLVTVIITIPTVVFNALLFIPRVNTKRYWAAWRIVPVVLSFTLAFIIFAGFFFGASYAIRIIDDLINFIDKYILFWTEYWPDDLLSSSEKLQFWKVLFNASFLTVACVGNVLILIGWYKAKPIGEIKKPENKRRKK